MNFLELAKARYSCRKMSDKPVEQKKLNQIIEAGIVAPTAKNLQPYKIWVVNSEAAFDKLKEALHTPFGAKTVLIIGGNKQEAFTRADGFNFAVIDATIVATHILLAIEDVGLETTWVGGTYDDAKLKEIFPEMKDYDIVALFPIGYAAEDAKPSPRHEERRPKSETVVVL